MVNARSSLVSDTVKQDSWEKNTGLIEGIDVDETTECNPMCTLTYQEKEKSSPIVLQRSDYHLKPPSPMYVSRKRKTILSVNRMVAIGELNER